MTSCIRGAMAAGLAMALSAPVRGQTVAASSADDSGSADSAATAPPPGSSMKRFPFRDLPYYEPLRAEPRAARNMILFPAWSKAFPNSVEGGSRFAWQIVLGKELPIFAVSNESVASANLPAGKWGLGLWIPLSFHVIEDFKDESNPIVDTDYRFGFMVKFQRGLTKTTHLGIKVVPWAHESTHIGDEYTIHALAQPGFERVNVSYEYREYGVSLEGQRANSDYWVLRTGGISPWNSEGYYDTKLLGSTVSTLTPSIATFEPSIGAEYRAHTPSSGLIKSILKARLPYLSVDTRHKLVYNYHQTLSNPEEQQWSWTVQAGATVDGNTPNDPLKQYFLQFYWGVNPYGQLRSQRDFWSIGMGWVFGY